MVLTKDSILELLATISFGMLRMSFPLSIIVTDILVVKQDYIVQYVFLFSLLRICESVNLFMKSCLGLLYVSVYSATGPSVFCKAMKFTI